VLIWLVILLLGKTLIVMVVARLFGESLPTSLRTCVILAHGGEFSLMLLSAAMASGVVPKDVGVPILLATGISMLFASLLIKRAAKE